MIYELPWVHLVGFYLLIGSLTSGLGLMARLRWQGYEGAFFPKNSKARVFFGIGIAIGVFLWPLVLLMTPVFRYFMRRRANRILGHCEHATPFMPFCKACGEEARIKKSSEAAARKHLAKIQHRIADRVRAGVLIPPTPRVPPAPVPASPEELEKLRRDLDELQDRNPIAAAPVGFRCTRCGIYLPGFPHAVDADQKAICRMCSEEASS